MRLGLDPESGVLSIDGPGKMEGRGGYCCPECITELRLDKRIRRAFRNRVRQLVVRDLTLGNEPEAITDPIGRKAR